MNTVTEAQVNFINRLKTERRWEDIPALEQQVENARLSWKKGQFSKRDASLLIHNLDLAAARELAPVIEEVSIEGMHRLDGQIYKVQVAVHGSGRPYAKVLVHPIRTGGFRIAVFRSKTTWRISVSRRPARELRIPCCAMDTPQPI
jgi:hypothetical protein